MTMELQEQAKREMQTIADFLLYAKKYAERHDRLMRDVTFRIRLLTIVEILAELDGGKYPQFTIHHYKQMIQQVHFVRGYLDAFNNFFACDGADMVAVGGVGMNTPTDEYVGEFARHAVEFANNHIHTFQRFRELEI